MIRFTRFGAMLSIAALSAGLHSCSSSSTPATPSAYIVKPLVANTAGLGATTVDTNLKNPWGLVIGPGGAVWVANNRTGTASHYDTMGVVKSKAIPVAIPGGVGAPTGIVYNTDQNSFAIPGVGPSSYIFATEDGTLNAIGFQSDSATAVSTSRRSSSVFKGLAIGLNNNVSNLYAANFKNATLDIFNQNFNYTQAVTDPNALTGYAPFNVAVINNTLFVTYAKQAANGKDDLPGIGNGFIDEFNLNGTFLKRFATGDSLNSPWGMALVTDKFGDNNNRLFVGNFGDGRISTYDPNDGSFKGYLKDANGNPIVIPGLWSLTYSNGILYYTAGPNNETNGVFGTITMK